MVRKELYCTKSILSKFAVHRHFNSPLSHKGNNTLQEESLLQISCLSTVVSGNPLLSGGGRSELAPAMTVDLWNTRNNMRTTQLPASCCQEHRGQEWKMDLRDMNLKKRHTHNTKKRGAGLKFRRST